MRPLQFLAALAALWIPALAHAQQAGEGTAASPVAEVGAGAGADATAKVAGAAAPADPAVSPPVARLLANADRQVDEGRLAAAQASLERAVARASAENDRAGRTQAAMRLGALLARSARLRVDASRVPLDAYLLVTVDGEMVPPDEWSRPMFVEPGTRKILVRRPGCSEHRVEVVAERGDIHEVSIPPLECVRSDGQALNELDDQRAGTPILFNPERSKGVENGGYTAGAIGAGAGAVGAGVLAVVFWRSAADNKEKADAVGCSSIFCSRRDGRNYYRSYESERKIAIAGTVVASVCAGVAIVSGVVAYRRRDKGTEESSSVAVAPVRGGGVIGWTGTF